MKTSAILSLLMIALVGGKVDTYAQEVNSAKLQKLAAQLSQIEKLGGDHLSYSAYALTMLERVFNIKPQQAEGVSRTSQHRTQRKVDVYALLSGGLAIRESLQLDTIERSSGGTRNIPVTQLQPPAIKSHPFVKMLAGRSWRAFALARVVPPDFYYLHFNDMHKALDFFDYLVKVGGALYQTYSPVAVDFKVKEKILNQLAIRLDQQARRFYNEVVASAAIIGSDPFLRQGTDVSVLYKLKNPLVFDLSIKLQRAYFQTLFHAQAAELTIQGKTVHHLYTPDRVIDSYLLHLASDLVLISNSAQAVAKIIAVFQGEAPALYQAPDFQYMRSIYPARQQTEDGFAYLSEAFIRRLVSPSLRIKEARRMLTAMRMAQLQRMLILYKQVFGRYATNSAQVAQAFYPRGCPFNFDDLRILPNSFGVISKEYGKIGYFKSNLETKLTMVSSQEAKAYRNFVKEYTNYWRDYFDPIGVRLKLGAVIKIETCILPLINNSIYKAAAMIFGGQAVQLSPQGISGEIVSLGFKFNRDKLLKSLGTKVVQGVEQGLSQKLGMPVRLAQLLGEELQIHVMDTRPLVDFDSRPILRELSPRSVDRHLAEVALWVFSLYSVFHPLRATLAVVDMDKMQALLNKLDTYLAYLKVVQERASFWEPRLDHYHFFYQGVQVRVLKISLAQVLHLRFYYALCQHKLVLTTTKDYMQKFIRSANSASPVMSTQANIAMVIRPNQMCLEKDLYESTFAEQAKNASFRNFGTLRLLSLLFPQEKNLPARCLAQFGFQPVSPAGGRYQVNTTTGEVSDSVFGTTNRPRIGLDMAKSSTGIEYFWASHRMLQLSLRFTPEGLMSVLVIK